jgi:predicted MFS family arabinose efflux permease
MILLSAIGNGVLVIQPLAVGAMVDTLGFTEKQAGFVVFTELASFSVGSMVMSGLIHRLNRRHVAWAGIALFALGSMLSAVPKDFVPFLLVRIIPGFACALCIAAFLGTAVLTKVPDKVFGLVNAFSIGYSAALLMIAPSLIISHGLIGIYFAMALGALACAGTVLWIPPRSPGSAVHSRNTDSGRREGAPRGLLIMVLMAMLLLYTGHGSVWAFQERIGAALSLDTRLIGRILSLAMTIGIVGSLLAWRSGLAIGRVWPQILSLGISVIAAMMLIMVQTALGFAIASALIALSWFYGLPYQMGLLAQLDPQGRANVMGIIMTTGGAALGPALAGMITTPGQYATIGWFAAACYSLCLLLVLPAVFFINRHHQRGEALVAGR